MTANEARTAILAARCAVVYFTKRDGTLRRMVCHVPEATDVRAFTGSASQMLVWDVEKGGIRTINLATVESVKAVQTRKPAPAGSMDALRRKYDTSEKISALFAF